MSCPPNWPGTIPEGSVRATDIALRDHITYYRQVRDSSKNRFRDDQWEKIDATVTDICGDRVILSSSVGHRRYKPRPQQIANGKPIRELWANEEERKPFAQFRQWEEDDGRVPDELWRIIAKNDAYERRVEKQGGFK